MEHNLFGKPVSIFPDQGERRDPRELMREVFANVLALALGCSPAIML
jgi:hypothetical protein